MMVRCAENIVNTNVFVRFHFLKFVRELGDFLHVFLPFLESIWDALGHRLLIFAVLGPCLKSNDF